jgi:hypothetical protein
MHRPACAAWLVVAVVETLIGVLAKWPAQFGGTGDPSKIATQWTTKGTALSPPLFLMIAMAVALAARTPDVPASAQDASGIGVVLSLAVVVSGLAAVVTPRPTSRREQPAPRRHESSATPSG